MRNPAWPHASGKWKHPGQMPGVSNGVDDSEMSYKQSFASAFDYMGQILFCLLPWQIFTNFLTFFHWRIRPVSLHLQQNKVSALCFDHSFLLHPSQFSRKRTSVDAKKCCKRFSAVGNVKLHRFPFFLFIIQINQDSFPQVSRRQDIQLPVLSDVFMWKDADQVL